MPSRKKFTEEEARERCRASKRAYYQRDRLRLLEVARQYRLAHRAQRKAARKKYAIENPGAIKKSQQARWQRRDREKARIARKKNYELKKHLILPKKAEDKRRRRILSAKATPAWANNFFILEAYDLSRRRTVATGFPWHVDHIVPIQGKTVCGLHWEKNLAVIPADENRRKSYRTWPDKP